jgi:hypothetical protein
LAGLYFGIDRGAKALEPLISEKFARIKAIMPASIFAWAIVNILFKLYLG